MGAKWQRPMNNNDPAEAHDQAEFWPSSINVLTQESLFVFSRMFPHFDENVRRGAKEKRAEQFFTSLNP